jgi:hypothetical protein
MSFQVNFLFIHDYENFNKEFSKTNGASCCKKWIIYNWNKVETPIY